MNSSSSNPSNLPQSQPSSNSNIPLGSSSNQASVSQPVNTNSSIPAYRIQSSAPNTSNIHNNNNVNNQNISQINQHQNNINTSSIAPPSNMYQGNSTAVYSIPGIEVETDMKENSNQVRIPHQPPNHNISHGVFPVGLVNFNES